MTMTDPEFERILANARAANDADEQAHYEEELARDDRLCQAFRDAGIVVPMPSKEEAERMYPPPTANSNPEGINQYTAWYEQAGKTAHSKSQAEHEREAGEHRARLSAMSKAELKRAAEGVGHFPNAGDAKGKIVDDLIRRATDRRGAVQRSVL